MPNIIKSVFRIFGKVIFIALLAVVVIFCINNTDNVVLTLKPLPFEVETRLCLIVILSLVVGVLLGMGASSISLLKEKFKNFLSGWKIKSLQRKVEKGKAKIEKLSK